MKNKKVIIVLLILIISIILIMLFSFDDEKDSIINKDKYTQIYLYDLGKSNIEIIIKKDFIFLINTGLEEDREELLDYLDKLGIREIDYLIVTNKDDKYIGNLDFILEHFKVDYLYLNDYEYSSKYTKKVFEMLDDAYTEDIILTSIENIKIDDLEIDIYPYMEDSFVMEDKSLIINIREGKSTIYLTNNISKKRFDEINTSTVLVGENIDILEKKSNYYIYDGNSKIKKDILKRNKEIYINEKELIIE